MASATECAWCPSEEHALYVELLKPCQCNVRLAAWPPLLPPLPRFAPAPPHLFPHQVHRSCLPDADAHLREGQHLIIILIARPLGALEGGRCAGGVCISLGNSLAQYRHGAKTHVSFSSGQDAVSLVLDCTVPTIRYAQFHMPQSLTAMRVLYRRPMFSCNASTLCRLKLVASRWGQHASMYATNSGSSDGRSRSLTGTPAAPASSRQFEAGTYATMCPASRDADNEQAFLMPSNAMECWQAAGLCLHTCRCIWPAVRSDPSAGLPSGWTSWPSGPAPVVSVCTAILVPKAVQAGSLC